MGCPDSAVQQRQDASGDLEAGGVRAPARNRVLSGLSLLGVTS